MHYALNFLLAGALVAPLSAVRGQEAAAQDKTNCIRNLRLIHDAIQAYRVKNKQFPTSLSELFPKFLSNADVLTCPAVRASGVTSIAGTGRTDVSDTRTSYFYEFNSAPLAEVPGKTHRDWKMAQMGLLGSSVPLVRCLRAHGENENLNLSFGGEIYESGLYWEDNFTEWLNRNDLEAGVLLAPMVVVRNLRIPPRDAAARPEHLDLSDQYTAVLGRSWLVREPGRALAGLPVGLGRYAGVRFDVRGVLQLASKGLRARGDFFPDQVTNIVVMQPCRRLQLLVGAANEKAPVDTQAAQMLVHYVDGQIRAFSLTNGAHLYATWPLGQSREPALSDAMVAWTGPAELSAKARVAPRLYKAAWQNPRPETHLKSLDFVSSQTEADLFVLAVTLER
jgi:hypothetical protein